MKILDKEIKELKDTISDNQKISKDLNDEFLILTDEAEAQKDLLKAKSILAKGNSLKRKAKEKLEDNKNLEDALRVLQEKRKKLHSFYHSYIFKYCFKQLSSVPARMFYFIIDAFVSEM